MRNVRPLLLVAVLCAIVSPHAREMHPPEHIAIDGAGQLRLAGHGRRTHLLGTVDLYTVAIYSEGAIDRERLALADVAKALRIEVTYTDDLHRPVSLDWRSELVPRVELAAMAHLRGSFAPLRQGDIVQIVYVPAKGTSVRVNKAVAVSGAQHDLMLAFLDHWLGDRPVSEDLKQSLLGSS